MDVVIKAIWNCLVKVGKIVRKFGLFVLMNFETVVITTQPFLVMWMIYMLLFQYASRGQVLAVISVYAVFILCVSNIVDEIRKARSVSMIDKLPTPQSRFTIKYSDRIEIQKGRIEELILYMDELEDYLERNGLLDEKKNEEKN